MNYSYCNKCYMLNDNDTMLKHFKKKYCRYLYCSKSPNFNIPTENKRT